MFIGQALRAVVIVCGLLVQSASAADAEQAYQEASDALYNLDFSIAQLGFEGLIREYPDDPKYWNALASTFWLKILYDQQKLNMESFSSRDRIGTRESQDAIDPADEKRLRDTIATAIIKAQAILNKNPKDVPALYALGVSNGTLASFEGTAKRSYRAALGKANEARNFHKRVLAIDPNFHDAEATVGIYNYVVGSIPFYIRWPLMVVGFHGEGKDLGIRQLERAAAQGKYAATDAKMLLVVVYNREQKFDQSLSLMTELHSRYPRNFLFEMSKASVFGRLKDWDRSIQTYRQILNKIENRTNGYERMRLQKVYYELGRSQIEAHQYDDARISFSRVIAGENATPDEKAGAHLWLGKMLDAGKDRPGALEHYNAVLALNCDPDLKEEAARYKRSPFVG